MVSCVSHTTCGVTTTLSSASNGLPAATGSLAKTSSPAAAMRPSVSAATSAASSITPPREVLISSAVGFIRSSAARSMSRSVSVVNGRCRVTMSLSASRLGSGRHPGEPSSRVLVCSTVAPIADTMWSTRLAMLP